MQWACKWGEDTFLNQQINVLEAKKTEVAVKHRGTGCSTGYGKSVIYVVLASSAKLVHVQMHGPSHVCACNAFQLSELCACFRAKIEARDYHVKVRLMCMCTESSFYLNICCLIEQNNGIHSHTYM